MCHLIFIFRPGKTSADQTGQVNGFVFWTTLFKSCRAASLLQLPPLALNYFLRAEPKLASGPIVKTVLKLHLVQIKFWSQINPNTIKSSRITANTLFPWAWKWYFLIVIPSEQKAPRYQASSLLIKPFPNSSLTLSASPLICSLCFGHAFHLPSNLPFLSATFPSMTALICLLQMLALKAVGCASNIRLKKQEAFGHLSQPVSAEIIQTGTGTTWEFSWCDKAADWQYLS